MKKLLETAIQKLETIEEPLGLAISVESDEHTETITIRVTTLKEEAKELLDSYYGE